MMCDIRNPIVFNTMLLALAALLSPVSHAEPFLAVETGLHCGQCHTNPTGGGMRNEFGATFAQTELPSAQGSSDLWTGKISERLRLGVDTRASARRFDEREDDTLGSRVDRVSLYLGASLNDHVSLYVDQKVAPGGSINREAWVKLETGDYYLKAGKLVLPFGLRLEDDTAITRRATGINFNTADNGVEFGTVQGPWSAQIAFTNGTAGAGATDGHQSTLRIAHVQQSWRVGISGSFLDVQAGERKMSGIFGGLRTGPVNWLAEFSQIRDDGFEQPDQRQDLGLLMASIRIRKGHYVHLTAEHQGFDTSGISDRIRYSAVYSFFPWSFTELRAGYRERDSDDPAPRLNETQVFLQLHAFF